MYVCICNAVTENELRDAVRDGAVTLSALQDTLKVSTCCGACSENVSDCLAHALGPAAGAALPQGA